MNKEKAIDIFEADKIAYHCSKCNSNILYYDRATIQFKKCPCCGSTDFKQLSKQELDNIKQINQIHIIIGIYSGVVDEVNAFKNDKDATEHEKALCQQYGIPFDQKEREQYYESNGEHEVKHIITEVQ